MAHNVQGAYAVCFGIRKERAKRMLINFTEELHDTRVLIGRIKQLKPFQWVRLDCQNKWNEHNEKIQTSERRKHYC